MSDLSFNARNGISIGVTPVALSDKLGNITPTSISTAGQITSTVSSGTPPLVISSTTNIPNLNASSLNGATFAAPGSIGSGTASDGTFTTVSATTFTGALVGNASTATTAANLSGTPALPSGVTATTQTTSDTSTLLATDAFVHNAITASLGTIVTSFNTRTGTVTLTSSDVTTALGYTPPTPTGTGASGTWAIDISGTATNATNINNNPTTNNGNYYPVFTSHTSGDYPPQVSTGFTVNPSTNAVTASSFVGSLTGNASSATNIAGGTTDAIPYQTGAGATSFISAGTNGYILTMVSGVPAWAASSGGVTSFNTRTGAVTLTSSDVTTALGYTPVNKAGDTLSGSISMNSNNITNIVMAGIPASNDVATVGYVNSISTGLIWQTSLLGTNLVSDTGTAPGSPMSHDTYIIGTGDNTGAWSTFLVGDVVQWQGASWVKIHTAGIGDRYGVTFTTTTTASGSFTGDANDIITISGGTPGAWTYTTTTPVNNWALTNSNPLSINYGSSFTYSSTLTKWVQFSSSITVLAGTGLYYSPSTTLNIQYGAGMAAVPTGDVGISVWTGGGLMTTSDGTTNSTAQGTQLSLTKVGTAGTYTSVTTDAYGRITAGTNPTPALATAAINLSGGTSGKVPYQSAASTTSFTAVGTSGQVLLSGGSGSPTWSSTPTFSAVTVNGLIDMSGFAGDQQKASNDPSPFREGSFPVTASGSLYTLVGDYTMKYWTHNTALNSSGNFQPCDDTGTCTLWVFTESGFEKTWNQPSQTSGSTPVAGNWVNTRNFNTATGDITYAGTITSTTAFSGPGTGLSGTATSLTAGHVTTNANLTGDVTSVGNATTLATVNTAGTYGTVTTNAKGLVTSGVVATPIANGGTGQTTASAAFNALSPITTTGDIIYSSSGTTNSRLGIGTSGYVLTVVSGVPAWAAAGGGTPDYVSYTYFGGL